MTCRILLADDLDHVRSILRIRLELEDEFRVVAEACDGERAVQLASVHQPDVVILDNRMPVLSGLEAIPLVKQVAPQARVVMFSSDNDLEHDALAAGADAFVNKSEPLESCVDQVAIGCRAA